MLLGRGGDKRVTLFEDGRGCVAHLRGDRRLLLREALVMLALGEHPHILGLHRLCVSCDDAFLQAPCAIHGSFLDLCDTLDFAGRGSEITDAHVAIAVGQIRVALAHIQRRGFVHSDVRARNILVFSFTPSPARIHVRLGDLCDSSLGHMDVDATCRALEKEMLRR